jgi:hypothetical protein
MKAISMSADPTLPRADPVTVARQLGWTNVEIIDDDLSRCSGIAPPLTSTICGSAYAFGRLTSRVNVENGCKRVRRGVPRPMESSHQESS